MQDKELEKRLEAIKQYIDVDKYSKSGIYGIKIDDVLVYIGQSRNMRDRIAAHIEHIEDQGTTKESQNFKYVQFRKAKEHNKTISFFVIDYCSIDELKHKEAVYINQFLPPFNSQVPSLVQGTKGYKKQPLTYEEVFRND